MDLLTFILFVIGLVLLIGGAELLVRGASRLAIAAGVSPLVVGLTVVAYGTSAPELAVTTQSTFAGQADIALGNVVGSNISNVLLVLGLSAMAGPLIVARQLIRLDIPLMVGLSFLVFFMGLDGNIGRFDGIILVAGAIIYTIVVIHKSRRENKALQLELDEALVETISTSPLQILLQVGFIVVGLAMLVTGADWLVDGAVAVAELLGVSKLVIGLTVVAVGTSLPEVATSVVASLRGERDIAVGNVVGSNIFNILLVLGASSAIAPAGVGVSAAALRFDIPVMIIIAVACAPIFFTQDCIERWEGALFFGYYIAYVAYLFLNASQSPAMQPFSLFILLFVIPATAIIILVSLIRHLQRQRPTDAGGRKRAMQETVPPGQS